MRAVDAACVEISSFTPRRSTIDPKFLLNCHNRQANTQLSNAIPKNAVTGSSGRSAHRHQLQTSMTTTMIKGAASTWPTPKISSPQRNQASAPLRIWLDWPVPSHQTPASYAARRGVRNSRLIQGCRVEWKYVDMSSFAAQTRSG